MRFRQAAAASRPSAAICGRSSPRRFAEKPLARTFWPERRHLARLQNASGPSGQEARAPVCWYFARRRKYPGKARSLSGLGRKFGDVGQTFLSAGAADFPVRGGSRGGDWKVARTGRQECLPYITIRHRTYAPEHLAGAYPFLFCTPDPFLLLKEAGFQARSWSRRMRF